MTGCWSSSRGPWTPTTSDGECPRTREAAVEIRCQVARGGGHRGAARASAVAAQRFSNDSADRYPAPFTAPRTPTSMEKPCPSATRQLSCSPRPSSIRSVGEASGSSRQGARDEGEIVHRTRGSDGRNRRRRPRCGCRTGDGPTGRPRTGRTRPRLARATSPTTAWRTRSRLGSTGRSGLARPSTPVGWWAGPMGLGSASAATAARTASPAVGTATAALRLLGPPGDARLRSGLARMGILVLRNLDSPVITTP